MKKFRGSLGYTDFIAKLYPEAVRELTKEEQLTIFSTADLTFQVTDACNLKCSYCYQINKGQHVMPFEVAKKFIDLLLENNSNTSQYINTKRIPSCVLDFIGGEPLLQVDLMDKIVDYFIKATILADHPWQYNYKISFATNGTLYFNQNVQNFLKKYNDHVSMSVTIDGNKELHDSCRKFPDGSGSYDLAIAAVKHYLKNYNNTMGSKITLAPANIQYTFEAFKDFIEFGYTEIFGNCVFEKGWTIDHAKIFYSQLIKLADYIIDNNLEEKIYLSLFESSFFHPKETTDDQNWCGGNGRMLAVDYKGDIFPCVRYMESSLGNSVPPVIIGNVNDGFLYTQKQKECSQCLKNVTRLSQSPDECINCSIAEGCAWCQAYNYQDSGDFNHRATYICIMHQARALANAYFWNKCYIKHGDTERMHLYLEDEKALQIISQEELDKIKKMETI